MKWAIFGKEYNEKKKENYQEFFDVMLAHPEIRFSIYKPFLEKLKGFVKGIDHIHTFESHEEVGDIAFMVSLGGDGTILESMLLVRDKGTPIIGLNTGRLGFLSSIPNENIKDSIESLISGEYFIDQRHMVKLVTKDNLFGETNFALNEVVIHKKDSSSMIIVHAYIDDEYFTSYWADGLIVSTPTGSTGYSLSCNGPIVMPKSEVFIISPIAPHNLNVRPLIIPDDKKIRLELEGRGNEFLVSLDSRNISIDEKTELIIEKEKACANLVRLKGQSFANTLRDKLSWGLDIRN